MTKLSVNVNKIAWLRNARDHHRPSVVRCCELITEAGANGLTVHPRPDQRHIRSADVDSITHFVETQLDLEFNIEGNPNSGPRSNGYPGFLDLVLKAQPDQCTLVPDTDEQLTSDHGFNLTNAATFDNVSRHIERLHSSDIRVSLFLDPLETQVRKAAESGADRIELFTGPWVEQTESSSLDSQASEEVLNRYRIAAQLALDLGLGVNAGHDLNLANLKKFCSIGPIDEVSIGHALISDALEFGLSETVRKYLVELQG